jgi:hypothetical protein
VQALGCVSGATAPGVGGLVLVVGLWSGGLLQVGGPLDDQAPTLVSESVIVPFFVTRSYVIAATIMDARPADLMVLTVHGCADHIVRVLC